MSTYPTPEKTWTITEVVPTPSGNRQTDVATLIYETKEAMLTLGAPWTVAGSSDGVTAGMDAVDRITDPSKINFTGGVGWWIVLEAPSGWGNGQLLLWTDAGGFSATNTHTKISLSGSFTGGSTSAAPTATDEDDTFNAEWLDTNVAATGAQFTCYIAQSTDGEHTRIFNCSNGAPTQVVVFETAGSPGSRWVDPRFYGRGPIFIRETPPMGNTAILLNGGRKWLKAKLPGESTFPFLYFSFPHAGQRDIYDSITLTTPNDIDGNFPLWNLGLYNYDTAGGRGEWGYIKDWWFTVAAANPGDFFPGDDSMQFLCIGTSIIIPWDGSTVPNFG
jgi:hypothetical protein